MNSALYFDSPAEAVEIAARLIVAEEWLQLRRYYDLSERTVEAAQLESGRFFVRSERPPVAHPGGFWRIKEPFHPSFRYAGHALGEDGIARVRVTMEIDQGGGMIQRTEDAFRMRSTSRGWQFLPGRPEPESMPTPELP